MKVVNEEGVVVETSSHPINQKHGRTGVEADCQPKVPMWTDFPANPILI
jgi:hypothetical protein